MSKSTPEEIAFLDRVLELMRGARLKNDSTSPVATVVDQNYLDMVHELTAVASYRIGQTQDAKQVASAMLTVAASIIAGHLEFHGRDRANPNELEQILVAFVKYVRNVPVDKVRIAEHVS